MQYRAAHPELDVYDLSYRELAADPVKAVRGIYDHFGIEFRPESEAGIRRWLSENPADKHGRHTYKLEDYGLTVSATCWTSMALTWKRIATTCSGHNN
jgi:hypothetical protein